jgi:hypothetical protein
MRFFWKQIASIVTAVALSSCGGGGSGGGSSGSSSGPVGSTTEFSFDSAYKAMVDAGVNKSWTVSGDRCGTATETDANAISATGTFGGYAATMSYTQKLDSSSVTICGGGGGAAPITSPQDLTAVGDTLFVGATPESNYWRVGGTSATPTYGEFDGTYQAPTVYVGLSDINLGKEYWYLDTHVNPVNKDGYTVLTLSISADGTSASTAIVDLISKRYDASATPKLLNTVQRFYRISASGPLVPIKIDIQYAAASGSTQHLILQ